MNIEDFYSKFGYEPIKSVRARYALGTFRNFFFVDTKLLIIW